MYFWLGTKSTQLEQENTNTTLEYKSWLIGMPYLLARFALLLCCDKMQQPIGKKQSISHLFSALIEIELSASLK